MVFKTIALNHSATSPTFDALRCGDNHISIAAIDCQYIVRSAGLPAAERKL